MNGEKWKEVVRCPLCNSTKITFFMDSSDPHYGIKGDFSNVKCGNCSLVFLNPMPSEDIIDLYPDTYYSFQKFSLKESRVKLFVKAILKIGTRDPHFLKPGRMLDIGCGSGKFLWHMKIKGWDTYGVEINKSAVELGKHYGLNIFLGTLLDAKFPDNFFDYIRLNHSFEHMVNPNEILVEIRRILKSTGKVLVGVPNINGLNAKIFGKYWWYLGAPVHPFNYSVKTLSMMLTKHNFIIENVVYNSIYSGILGSIQIYFNRNSEKLSSDGFFIKNPMFIFFFHLVSKFLDLLKLGDSIEITSHKKRGK